MLTLKIDWKNSEQNPREFESASWHCDDLGEAIQIAEKAVTHYGAANRIEVFEDQKLVASLRTLR